MVWGPWPTVGFALAIGIILTIALTVVLLIIMFTQLDPESLLSDPNVVEEFFFDRLGMLVILSTTFAAMLGTAMLLGVIKLRRGKSFVEYLALRRATWKTTGVTLAIVAAFMALSKGLGIFVDQSESQQFMFDLLESNAWQPLLCISMVILAPLSEELIFRGFLLVGFQRSRLGDVGAVGLTSMIWAGLHLPIFTASPRLLYWGLCSVSSD